MLQSAAKSAAMLKSSSLRSISAAKGSKRFFSDKKNDIPQAVTPEATSTNVSAYKEANRTQLDNEPKVVTKEKIVVIPSSSGGGAGSNIPPASTSSSGDQSKDERKEIKKSLTGKPPFMNAWYLFGAASFAGAAMYYYNESDNYNRKVDPVMKMIDSPDRDTRRSGFLALERALYLDQRLFSRSIAIPQPKTVLVERGIVTSLMNAVNDEDRQLRQTALQWLLHFADDEGGRHTISQGVNNLISIVASSPIGSPLWISGSSLLLKLSKYDDSKAYLATPSVSNALSHMYKSGHPLATLMAGSIARYVAGAPGGVRVLDDSGIPRDEIAVLNTSHCLAALNAAIKSVPGGRNQDLSVNPIFSSDTLLHLNWALLFAGLGSIYGRIRWNIRARLSGLSGPAVGKFVRKHSRTGRYVFLLLGMDLASQAIMSVPPEGVPIPYTDQILKVPKTVGDLPLSTAVPIGEAALFTLVGLYAIRTQRYVVLPVLLASTLAHWDTIQKYTKPVQKQLGVEEYFNYQLPSFMTFSNNDRSRTTSSSTLSASNATRSS